MNHYISHRQSTIAGSGRLRQTARTTGTPRSRHAICGVACGLVSTLESTDVKTIQMTIDERLLKLVDRTSRARKTSRSAFIRTALEAEIRRDRVREEEIRHVEGYTRNPVAPGEFDAWLGEQEWGPS